MEFAKNRLNNFYNPSQYKAPPKRELSEDEQIASNMGGTLAPTEAPGGIASIGIGFVQNGAALPPPHATDAALQSARHDNDARYDFLEIALRGGRIGFEIFLLRSLTNWPQPSRKAGRR